MISKAYAARAAEIYTYPAGAATPEAIAARRGCLCRFRGPNQECDQTEHRGSRAFLQLAPHAALTQAYGRTEIPLGLCSMWSIQRHVQHPWVVCPHRLFYAGPTTVFVENWIYQAWGLNRGDRVALWKEVKIQAVRESKKFDFTFDYVFRKVIKDDPLLCDEPPFLVEVMTASTAGGGVESTFLHGLQDPLALTRTSINYRQVIARMMSQFIAKAQAGSEWGGKAVWIVQDLLWRYVERTTGFNRDAFYNDPNGNVVVVVRRLETHDARDRSLDTYTLRLEQIIHGWDRFERSRGESYEGRDFVSMLNAPFTPNRTVILNATNRAPLAILTCA